MVEGSQTQGGWRKMKEAVNFLRTIYSGSFKDIATIIVAEADGDKEIIRKYLLTVLEYTNSLIEKL